MDGELEPINNPTSNIFQLTSELDQGLRQRSAANKYQTIGWKKHMM